MMGNAKFFSQVQVKPDTMRFAAAFLKSFKSCGDGEDYHWITKILLLFI